MTIYIFGSYATKTKKEKAHRIVVESRSSNRLKGGINLASPEDFVIAELLFSVHPSSIRTALSRQGRMRDILHPQMSLAGRLVRELGSSSTYV